MLETLVEMIQKAAPSMSDDNSDKPEVEPEYYNMLENVELSAALFVNTIYVVGTNHISYSV